MAVVFENYNPKIPKKGIFGLKIDFFAFYQTLCFHEFEGLISNMTIVFQNQSPKIPKNCAFGPKLENILFCKKLCDLENSSVLASNMTIVFAKSYLKITK